jgi:hypothetical protein
MRQTLYGTIVAFISLFLLSCCDQVPAERGGEQDVTLSNTNKQDGEALLTEEVSDRTRDVLKRAEDALEALDADALVSLYAENFKFEDTSAGLRINDKTALRAYFDRLFQWPDCTFYDVSYFGLGQRAAGQWTMGGSSKPSGDRFSIRGASIFKIEGNKIAEEIIFYDPRPSLH